MKQQDKVFMVVGSTAVLIAAGVTGVWLFGKDNTASTVNATSSTSGTTTSAATASSTDSTSTTELASTSASSDTGTTASSTTSTASYKDGTYSATVSYTVPRASNSLTAKVTIAGGKVTAVTVDNSYSDHESGRYIDNFESAIESAVVGQSIDGLSLGRIAGATLTTVAFDDALTQIRSDAKV